MGGGDPAEGRRLAGPARPAVWRAEKVDKGRVEPIWRRPRKAGALQTARPFKLAAVGQRGSLGSVLIKCNCNHCSAHLEFEPGHQGQTIQCPICGIDTELYTPAAPAGPPPIPAAKSGAATAGELRQVRAASCYKTLRSLFDTLQLIWVAVAVIVGIYAIGLAIAAIGSEDPVKNGALPALGLLLGSAVAVVLAIVAKQAALLLVDIADCQIQARPRS